MSLANVIPSIRRANAFVLAMIATTGITSLVSAADALEQVWEAPPRDARIRGYWWWINGNVTREAITHDLEEMKAKGWGGALICDADGSSQDGNDKAPHGPTFFSPEWRELYKHSLREADRLGLEMSLNIQSGWNLGGPMVKAEDAPKKLVWTETRMKGEAIFSGKLDQPKGRDGFYRDLFVVAYRANPSLPPSRKPLQNQPEKALLQPLRPFSAPDTSGLFQEFPAVAGEEDARASEVIDLTTRLSKDGGLDWAVTPGDWVVLRFGFTLNDHCRVSTCSEGWDGYAVDPFDSSAFQRYWNAVVEPLIDDAGPLAGRALKYLHTDSWEVEVANWTPDLHVEFQKRRGYDMLPWLPVIAGKILNSRDESHRFLADFRKTLGDLAIDHHYRIFRDRAHARGLEIHPESGGPHAVPIDAQRCLGFNDAPMSEFWAWSWRHRVGDENRFFVKQPASAAHTYGRKLVLAEGFTTIGPHWQETVWDNLKPSFDKAICEGLNLLVWHAFVCSPKEMGIPGQQYFAGTHFNPNTTWWDMSGAFISYMNRCQALMQSGLPVSDVLYYYGDHVPNFTQLKRSDPARILPGYDYDVITEEAILERLNVRDGRLVLPDGANYRLLALPGRDTISLPVLRKLEQLAKGGAVVTGVEPRRASTLQNYPQCDAEVSAIGARLWRSQGARPALIRQEPAREILRSLNVPPDFEVVKSAPGAVIDYIHRQTKEAEIYFVASRSNRVEDLVAAFRVAGKAPELWDPVSGRRQLASAYQVTEGRTSLPLRLEPCGSVFVIFRKPSDQPASGSVNHLLLKPVQSVQGTWSVRFDPKWGGPAQAEFADLKSWTERSEPGIRHYSGTATYRMNFDCPKAGNRLWLDLGNVREMARVRLNGTDLGVVWTPPFRVEVTGVVKPTSNQLEVEVVNFWPNRIIGDDALPKEQRLTQTNIRKLTKAAALMPSGLLGPVQLMGAD